MAATTPAADAALHKAEQLSNEIWQLETDYVTADQEHSGLRDRLEQMRLGALETVYDMKDDQGKARFTNEQQRTAAVTKLLEAIPEYVDLVRQASELNVDQRKRRALIDWKLRQFRLATFVFEGLLIGRRS